MSYMVSDASLISYFKLGEGLDNVVRDDEALPKNGKPGHNPTIGYGFNLRDDDVLWLVLENIRNQAGQNVFQAAGQMAPLDIFNSFKTLVATYPGPAYADAQAFENEISNMLNGFEGLPSQVAGNTSFTLSANQSSLVLQGLVSGTNVEGVHHVGSLYSKLTDRLSHLGVTSVLWPPNNTSEAAALMDLIYNGGPGLIGKGIANALIQGNRADLWYEIRYNSDAGSPANGNGNTKRRYWDSAVFGGPLVDPTNISDALQAYSMLTRHRSEILKYEANKGTDPDGTTPTAAANRIADAIRDFGGAQSVFQTTTVPTLTGTFDAAEQTIIDVAKRSVSNGLLNGLSTSSVRSTDIFVAPSEAEFSAGLTYRVNVLVTKPTYTVNAGTGDGDSASGISEAFREHVVVGQADGEILIGGAGQDVIIAGSGDETLVGGGGFDTLVGGDGGLGADVLVGNGIGDVLDFEFGATTSGLKESVVENGLLGVDSLYVNGVLFGSGALPAKQLPNVWTDGQDGSGTRYEFYAHPTDAPPTEYSPSGAGDDVGELKIFLGGPGGNEIDIWGFDLSQAEKNPLGFMGIKLPVGASLTAYATAGIDPPTPNIASGTTQSYTVSVDTPSATDQIVTVTLNGASGVGFSYAANGVIQAMSGSSFTFTLRAGESSASFALINTSDPGSNASLSLSAQVSDGTRTATTAALTFDFVSSLSASGGQFNSIAGTVDNNPTSATYGATLFRGDGQNDSFQANANGRNYIDATQPGNDSIVGSQQSDTIVGGAGSDTVFGGGGTDLITLGNGNNKVYAGVSSDVAYAIEHQTPAAPHAASTTPSTLTVGEVITVGNGNNTVVADDSQTYVVAGNGNNQIVLGAGNDVFIGGAFLRTQGRQIDWTYEVAPGFGVGENPDLPRTFFAQGEGYTYTGALPYHGLYGNGVMAGGGNDTVYAGSGDQFIELSNGNDFVQAGSGNNNIFGGMGSDTIVGGTGNNFIRGGGATYVSLESGNNTIEGGVGDNTLLGGSGNDLIYATATDISDTYAGASQLTDFVDGGAGNDTIYGSAGYDTLNGGSGNDVIYAGSGTEVLFGGEGNDRLIAGSGNDVLEAGAGDDSLCGADGHATLYGGSGSDSLVGGSGDVVMYAGDGGTVAAPTVLEAGSGNSTLFGGLGTDLLEGSADASGSAVIYMGDGRAQVNTGAGSTTVYGGLGQDVIVGGTGSALIYAGDGGTEASPTQVFAGTGRETIVAGAGVVHVSGAGSNVTLLIDPDNSSMYVDNSAGAATLDFNVGIEPTDLSLTAALTSTGALALEIDGASSDIIVGGLTGAVGAINFLDPQTLSLKDLIAQDGVDTTITGAHGDLIFSVEDAQTVVGGTGQDSISAWGNGDTLIAGSGGDTLYVDGNDDSVTGGAGADTMIVDAGISGARLEGGAGDTYVLNMGFGNTEIVQDATGGTLSFGKGISLSDLSISLTTDATGEASLVISDGSASVTLDGGLDGRVSSIHFADGSSYTFNDFLAQVASAGGSVRTTAADGSSTLYVLNASPNTTTLVAYGYDPSGNLLHEHVLSQDGSTTDYDFNVAGQITRIATNNANGSTGLNTYLYNADGSYSLTAVSTAAGATVSTTVVYDYDTGGHLTSESVHNPDGSTETYTFDGMGRVTGVTSHGTDGSSAVDTYVYNAGGSYSLTAVTTAAGASGSTTVVYGYDTGAHLVSESVSNPDGSTAGYLFDTAGRITGTTAHNADGSSSSSTYQYSADGSYTLTAVTTPAGSTSSTTVVYGYDTGGHLISENVYNPDGTATDYTFDASGRISGITSYNADGTTANAVDTYHYNSDGSYTLTAVTTPAGSTASTTVVYSYDTAARLISEAIQTPDGTNTTYSFDTSGRTTGVSTTNADGSSSTSSYLYEQSGAYTLTNVSTAAGATSSTQVVYGYDQTGHLRTEFVTNSDTSTANYFFDGNGRITETASVSADGSTAVGRYSYAADGSYTLTSVSTTNGAVTTVGYSYDPAGHLIQEVVHNPDQSSTTYTFNTSGAITGIDSHNSAGATVSNSYSYHADGSYSLTSTTTPLGTADGTTVVYEYTPAGALQSEQVWNPDGSTALYTFDATGRIASINAQNADGSTTFDTYTYNADGSYSLTADYVPASGGAGTVVVYNYDAQGTFVSDTVGTETSTQSPYSPDGTITKYFGPGGIETHDAWQRTNGSSGSDVFFPDGATSAYTHFADGTSSTVTNDGHGDIRTTLFTAQGVKASDTWQRSDGTYGSDTFNPDGSSSRIAHNVDGSITDTEVDSYGDVTVNYENAAGVLQHDSYRTFNGYYGTDQYAADGVTVISDTFGAADGSYGSDTYNADGSTLAVYNDGLGNADTTLYAADGVTVLRDHQVAADGTVTDKVNNSDHSSVTTWSDTKGEYGFYWTSLASESNGQDNFEYRGFAYNGLNNWSAYDQYSFGDGARIESTTTPNNGNTLSEYIQYGALDGWNYTVITDENFGVDALAGITQSYQTVLGEVHQLTGVSVTPGALDPVSSSTVKSLAGGADPFAAIVSLIDANHAQNQVKGIVYAQNDPADAGYLTLSGGLYHFHGINGSSGLYTGDIYDPVGAHGGGPGSGGGSAGGGSNGGGSGGVSGGFSQLSQNPDGSVTYISDTGQLIVIDPNFNASSHVFS